MGLVRFIEAGAEARHREGDEVALEFPSASALIFDKTSGRRLDASMSVR
jgi:hypothetical protein